MATQANQSVHSGNTVLLKVKGQVIGRAQSLDGRRSFGTEGVYEIGSIMPQEHINNRYEGTVSLERFLIKKSDMAKIGLAALGEEILSRDIIDIEVISKYNNEVVRVYRGCTAVDYSENFRVGAISGENATFQYLSCDRGNTDTEILKELYEGMSEDVATFMANNTSASYNAVTSGTEAISGYYEGTATTSGGNG